MKICDTIKNMFKHKEPEKDDTIQSAEHLAQVMKEATGKDIPVFKIFDEDGNMPQGYRDIIPINEESNNE